MNIYTLIPYDLEKNLGGAYNKFMNLLEDDDWAVFLDHDAMFTTPDWMSTIEKTIDENPEYGFFTCRTNRIGSAWQKMGGVDEENHDMRYHRSIGREVSQVSPNMLASVADVTDAPYMSGVVMIVKKSVWKELGGAPEGMLGVDGQLHIRCRESNIKLGLMNHLYVYHWYRGDGNTNHLENKQGY
jgi:GT2 family glycosyltransferase